MVSDGYHDTGEEWAQKHAWRQDKISRGSSVDVLLYSDADDSLGDSDDIDDISTEPDSGDYSRVSFDLDSNDIELSTSGGDLRITAVVTFDVTDTTETIDAYAVVGDFQSDVVNDEDSLNEHLITTADVGETDLGENDEVDVEVNLDLD